jgi:hypothetical protein
MLTMNAYGLNVTISHVYGFREMVIGNFEILTGKAHTYATNPSPQTYMRDVRRFRWGGGNGAGGPGPIKRRDAEKNFTGIY